jgi:isopenicillin-N epimerase
MQPARADALPAPSPLASSWSLDPNTVFLNHGSFGATPRAVLDAQSRWRDRMERDPVRFFVEEHQEALDAARRALASFLHCRWDSLALLPNATFSITTVLRHLAQSGFIRAGDVLAMPDHEYPACQANVRAVAERVGVSARHIPLPFPLPRDREKAQHVLMDAFSRGLPPGTRVVLLSHATSPTGLILPVEAMVRVVRERFGRDAFVIIDGAHGAGFIPDLRPDALGADAYTSNCHKWLCTPKGSAFLWVSDELRERIRPLVLSNNAESPKSGRPQFLTEFDYTGTQDCTAHYVIPETLSCMTTLVSGGWPEIIARNHDLCLRGRDVLCRALSLEACAPDAMLGSTCSLVLPLAPIKLPTRYADALQDALLDRWRIQVPVWNWTLSSGRVVRILRISAQLYNSIDQYEYLAQSLRSELAREASAGSSRLSR